MFEVKVHETSFRTIKASDPDFTLYDGFLTANRAGFEISQRCPAEYKLILQDCIHNGWIKPVATVYDWELTYSRLKNE